jgi:hypothetical protein
MELITAELARVGAKKLLVWYEAPLQQLMQIPPCPMGHLWDS